MTTWKCSFALAPVVMAGCATGFDRAALQERLNDGSIQTTDTAIAEARAARPQLRLPCRVAVFLAPPDRSDWRWTAADRAAMEPWAAVLQKAGVASAVFPLPDLLAGKAEAKGDSRDLRLAAAKCGADVLLVVRGAAETDSYRNPAAVLDLTIVGGYLVPSRHKDSLFMMEGCLLDVDNGYVYAGVRAEGVGKIVRPSFIVEEKDAIDLAKTKAIGQFGDELVRRLKSLADAPPPLPPAVSTVVPSVIPAVVPVAAR